MTPRVPRRAGKDARATLDEGLPTNRRVGPRVGRPSLLDATAQENIVRALRAGAHLKHAVESFGISYTTAARWIADGAAHAEGRPSTAQRDNLGAKADEVADRPCVGLDELNMQGETVRVCRSGQHPFREFREAVVRARAEAVVTVVGRVQEAARSGNVTAQLALLRALAPEEWGETRRVRVEDSGHAGCGGPPLIIELYANDRDPKELAEIMASLEED